MDASPATSDDSAVVVNNKMDGSLGKQRAERPEMSPADIKYTPAKELLSTAQPNRLLQRNLQMDYDEPPSLGLEVPESYLAAMRALQQ